MDGLDPFLANFNPLLRWLDYQAPVVTDFLANPSSSTADFLPFQAGQSAPLHLSRQMTIFTAETLSVYPQPPRHEPRQRLPAAVRDRQLLPEHAGRDLPEPRLQQHLRRSARSDASDPPPARARRRRRAASSRSPRCQPERSASGRPELPRLPDQPARAPRRTRRARSRRTSRRSSAAVDPRGPPGPLARPLAR